VRLWLKNATDVKNVEAALGGKSDPYVRVLVNNITQARTEVVNNSTLTVSCLSGVACLPLGRPQS